MHQFVISGLDFRIAAGFCPETAQWLHRFLISGSDLRITVEGVGRMELGMVYGVWGMGYGVLEGDFAWEY